MNHWPKYLIVIFLQKALHLYNVLVKLIDVTIFQIGGEIGGFSIIVKLSQITI